MPKDKPAPKSTNFEISKRINRIYDMLLLGISRTEIVKYGIEQWGVEIATIDGYIKRANKLFAEQSAYDRNEELGRALSRLNYLLQKNMQIQDYKTALAVQREMNLIIGLYAPKETKLNINIDIVQRFITVAQAKGYDPAQLFNDMIAELSQVEAVEADNAPDSDTTD